MKARTFQEVGGWGWLVFSRVATALVIAMGGGILVGWALDWVPLIRLLPTLVVMNPVTAATFLLAGASLWRLSRGGAAAPNRAWHRSDRVGLVLAGLVTLVGALKVADYLFGLGFHVDHLLFPRKLSGGGSYPPSEMAPNTALNFLCCGLALAWMDRENRRGFRLAQGLILIAGLVSLLALVGYAYRVLMLYQVGTALPMALDSAIAFTLFCLAFLAARPRSGIMRIITSPTPGGAMARRLLPMAVLIPLVLGALLLMGEQAGHYRQEFALASFAAVSIVVFTSLIWWNAKLLYLVDRERGRTERRLAAQHDATRGLAESRDLSEAMARVLRGICQALDWEMGSLWTVDTQKGALRCVETWHRTGPAQGELAEASRRLNLAKGVGLPGRVWAEGQPVRLIDAPLEGNFPRAALAGRAGVHGAVGFPVVIGQEFFGVLEFFSRRLEPPDPALLEMLASVASQVGLFIERTRAEAQLRQTSANLARSNTDLQQFAYVASHDLFEPLRMVTSYLQLLSHKYRTQLDTQAQEFIGFALDGAKRMEALIHDLLAYSRVDMRGRAFELTEGEQVFKAAIANLKVAIEETGATITHEPLPRVRADSVQLTQLFQNLIGNAIKFHGAEPPRIELKASRRDGEWLFLVRDNGIGIDPKFFERIFIIFQRLHTRQEYAGTGMGLAICKKIIERHGGRIWVESVPGKGSTFFFTLPALPEDEPAPSTLKPPRSTS